MKFLLYSDVHFCETSSIVRSFGNKYSTRLEGLIKSVNWAESFAKLMNCDEIICLGDFFNTPDLNSREITALQEINWIDLPHTFLVGNHDACDKSLFYNSVSALKNNGFNIIYEPSFRVIDNKRYIFLPYISESERKDLSYYTDNFKPEDTYIFSHNDIKGLQYGSFLSKDGFDIAEIEKSCKIFLNGHLHNMNKFCVNGLNIGNLTGQNFSEDANLYPHCCVILDTADNSIEMFENPYALNFYKLDYTSSNDSDYSFEIKENAVLSIRCKTNQADYIRSALNSNKNSIIEARVVVVPEVVDSAVTEELIANINQIDHRSKFIEFCLHNLTPSDLLTSELQEICR